MAGYFLNALKIYLSKHKALPKFKEPLKVVIAGGTSRAEGYVETFEKMLEKNEFPLPVKEVVHADDPLHAVAKGCLIAAQVL